MSYTDPYVPTLSLSGRSLEPIAFEAAVATTFDCAVIATDHRAFDYQRIGKMPLVVDTRAYWFNDMDYHGVLADPFFRYSIRVDGVFAPGFVETEMLAQLDPDRSRQLRTMIPSGRFGTTEDVADLVCFLGSDRAAYITGQVIQVDGGLVL